MGHAASRSRPSGHSRPSAGPGSRYPGTSAADTPIRGDRIAPIRTGDEHPSSPARQSGGAARTRGRGRAVGSGTQANSGSSYHDAVNALGPWWEFRLGSRLPTIEFRPIPRVDAGVLVIMRRSRPLLPVAMALLANPPRAISSGEALHGLPEKGARELSPEDACQS
jgi:hypothetical protein